MDRTQYGKVTVSDTYRPYDIICKQKPLPGYALLADLQTNLNKSTHPAAPLHHTSTQHHTPTTVITNHQPKTEITRTIIHDQELHKLPPSQDPSSQPTSPPPHIYRNDDLRKPLSQSTQNENIHVNGFHHQYQDSNRSSTTSASSPPNTQHTYQNLSTPKDQMYRHETREEVRTETRSSGPNPSPQRSAITNNLSELDTLLHDLNTTKKNSFHKESTVVNGSRPSVDSLLDELNSVGHRETVEKRTSHHETRTVNQPPPHTSYPQKVSHVSASNATKELDDLMESLSDFKGNSNSLKKETLKSSGTTSSAQTRVSRQHVEKEKRSSDLIRDDAPPRPPTPEDKDVFAVPPPRPPAPSGVYVAPPDIPLPAVLPAPVIPSPTPATVSIIYSKPDEPQYRPPDALVEDSLSRPESGGPVKRNDREYRWVTDQIKHEVREIVEQPPPPPEVEEKVKINASSLQTQVDTAYAKPLPKRRSPSPPPPPQPLPKPKPQPQTLIQPPPPAPKPSPPNQLDSMLGSLTSHMTEQGINTSQKGCCCACDKPIVGQVITALGKTWHPEHFTCTHCKEELGTKNFFERDGKPYCEPDYHNLFSPKCAYCSGPILDKCVTAMNTTWHPEHFFCAQCGNTFGEEGFHEKNGKPYCKEDYFNMFAPKCGGCANPIMENYISALNAQWHPECFVCRDCNQPFNGGSFFDHEGLPYCETHYHAKRGSLCAACSKPITGRCITAMFRKYHPEHFLCAFCLQQLNKGTFKEQNNKPYCHSCFDKLYG